jgi:hypothetical protein
MTTLLIAVFGVIPVIVLGLLAFAPLLGGLAVLFEMPSEGALFITWGTAGVLGAVAMLQAAGGRHNENTTLGLLAGIGAAAPLAYAGLAQPQFPATLIVAYFTVGPILVAAGLLAKRLSRRP